MTRALQLILAILLVAGSGLSAKAVKLDFPSKSQDLKTMNALMAKVEKEELSLEEALVAALEKGISFEVIIDACNLRGIALSNVISAAATLGISPEAILAWMSDAKVPKEQMVAAYTEATGQHDVGLGYTPAQETEAPTPVTPVTANPGGRPEAPSVSPSAL